MKMLTALLVAVALLVPAVAQKTTFQGTHPRPKLTIVAPASKPMLLHTGKPLTLDQKRQLAATVVKNYALKAPAGTIIKVTDIAQSPKTVMTPGQLSLNGVNTMADNLKTIDTTYDGYLYFVAGESSSMTFIVPLKKNTVTILDMKVFLVNDNAQMTASNLWYMNDTKVTSGETFNGSSGDNEFAYSFVSDKAGDNYFEVTFFSPNSDWFFKSCEITSTAF